MMAGETLKHRVRKVEHVTDELFVLELEKNDLSFSPGDCVALYTESGQSRPYSIASGCDEESLRFVIRRMEGGEVSPWLMARKPGDRIELSEPFGWFRPGQDIGSSAFVFIATGTGVAPFLSYLDTFSDAPPALFLYGVRRKEDAVGADVLSAWCPFRLAVSREQRPSCHHGRVTDLLHELPLGKKTHYYLCGLSPMINEVGGWLEEQGVPLSSIHREVFFHA